MKEPDTPVRLERRTGSSPLLQGLNLLIVDDDAVDAEAVLRLLKTFAPDALTTVCSNPDEAPALIRACDFDVCLLDHHLGRTFGLDLLSHAAEAGCSKPIILLTGQDNYDLDVAAMKAGAADYLAKDELSARSLERALRYALNDHKNEQLVREKRALVKAAYYDMLTGLPNRALFLDRLEQAAALSSRTGEPCGVLFIDLDGFKLLNDTFGHGAGDKVLVTVSKRLRDMLRESDTVARLGGDEFTVLSPGLNNRDGLTELARRLRGRLNEPFSLGDREVKLSASVGVALWSPELERAEDLLKNADIAMYFAKKGGAGDIAFFGPVMQQQMAWRFATEQALSQADFGKEMGLVYQPIVNIAGGAPFGFEALLRWRREDQTLAPTEFLNVAEETGHIRVLGAWALQAACTWAAATPKRDVPRVMVNVSARQVWSGGFARLVLQTLKQTGLDPARLCLEITESLLLKNPEVAGVQLKKLRAYGVRIYLDDFGTGYSSLSQLLDMPLDGVKIDRSFVRNLRRSERGVAFLGKVHSLAESLDLEVIAEGVENREQLDVLTGLGFKLVQGYFCGRPQPPRYWLAGSSVQAG